MSLISFQRRIKKRLIQTYVLNLLMTCFNPYFCLTRQALFDNYNKYMSELINTGGYDIPIDYISIFCFEGLYETCLYYASKLKNNENKRKVIEDNKKACRLLAKAIMYVASIT